MKSNLNRLNSLQYMLRLTYGLIPLAAGLDKFFNILTRWEQYVSPSVAQFLPFSTSTFMHVVGIIEMAAGIVVLSRFTILGAYVVSAWLTLIAVSLIFSGHYLDVAVRDIVMAVGAYSLGVLSEALGEQKEFILNAANAAT
ncbi:MAG TPA: hypothetical protein VGJ48_18905 [Pyrinomonadaceae bacterium]